MCVEAIMWVLKQDIKPASAKHVLMVMANCANPIDFVCYPSIAYLVAATSQDRKTVIKNMEVLRQRGYIKNTGQFTGRSAQVHVYQLCQPKSNESNEGQEATSPKNGTGSKKGTGSVFPIDQYRFSALPVPFLGHGKVMKDKESTSTVPIPNSNSQKQNSAPNPKIKPNDEKIDDCPVEEIIDMFELHFPMARKSVRPLNNRTRAGAKRIAAIRARWNEAKDMDAAPFGFVDVHSGLKAFDRFFKINALSRFLRGEAEPSPKRKRFIPNIDTFMSPSFFVKCLEYKYHDDEELYIEVEGEGDAT
jgi:hypothetical protein